MGNFSITQYGKPLDESLYTIDLENEVFTSAEHDLVLDFTYRHGWTFKTGDTCTFKTGYGCTFNTGHNCTFKTGEDCTFTTGMYCTFNCTFGCTFKTGNHCTFATYHHGTFDTGYNCTFKTGNNCTFATCELCIFLLYDINTCKFKPYKYGNSIILDRKDSEAYKLTKEFVALQKVKNG